MPVFVCQSGSNCDEPWRRGIQVYGEPFDINSTTGGGNDWVVGVENDIHILQQWNSGHDVVTLESTTNTTTTNATTPQSPSKNNHYSSTTRSVINASQNSPPSRGRSVVSSVGHPIRRVRHSEIVLIDDVCIAHQRYWLRLRWPGRKGGFAGYISMGVVDTLPDNTLTISEHLPPKTSTTEDENNDDDIVLAGSAIQPAGHSSPLRCFRTGLSFPTSSILKLCSLYDDGIRPHCTIEPYPTDHIFCRICREGLHDDADAEQPTAEQDVSDNVAAMTTNRKQQQRRRRRDPSNDSIGIDSVVNSDNDNNKDEGNYDCNYEDYNDDDENEENDSVESLSTTSGPVHPTPSYHVNTDALQNPMLAPCACSGSMAFVHYLCVEQWRCRSRHPDAMNGLNCETCKAPYGLPAPASRPDLQIMEHEEWIEVMPPHVMQALRNPHVGWQIGAIIVNKRWLRPLAPIIMSPIVALYCRSRRLLKKRGVARRRWSCSLCRRRARWKCVRCLRSYYCSRQCQNVSWHIIHKHVCYKPIRVGGSVCFYTFITVLLIPSIVWNPIRYAFGISSVATSFFTLAVLFGNIATIIKNMTGSDIRGRLLEIIVTLLTMWMSITCWGLLKGFLGDPSACIGTFGKLSIPRDEFLVSSPSAIYVIQWIEYLSQGNCMFFVHENSGDKCASDIYTLFWIYVATGLLHYVLKLRKDRQRRMEHQRRIHLHQD